jgi:cytochrome P450
MRARGLHARIQGLVDELLGAVLARGEADFIAELAEPLPVHVIADWLGWPREERQRLRPWSAAIVRLYEADHDAADEVRAEAAVCEFAAMMQTLIEARHAQPRHDLISALVALEDEPEGLSRDELIATCMLVLNAGHEATVNAAGNGLLALLRHPAQMERLRAEAALMHSAVEELLRYDSPLQLFRRFALEDLAYGGVAIARGEQVGLLYGSANRDGAAFEHADALNLARRPNVHLAFGGGKHYCIGAPLARLELQLLYGALLQRMPKLELDEPMPPRRPGHVFRGLRRLRVRW